MLTLAAILVTTAAAWPIVRLLSISGFRNRLRAFPVAGFAVPLLVPFYVALVAGIALTVPSLLHALAALVVCAAVYAAWRSRPSYGHRRGLPPGRLSAFRPDAWRDREFYLREAARYGPVFKICHVVQPMICIADMHLASVVLRQHDDVLVPVPLPYNRHIPRGFLRYMNEDDRRRYAPLFRTAFAPRVVDDARPDFDAIVRGELEMMAAQSADMAGRGISPTPGLQKMAFTALARTLLGVDRQDPALKRLADLCSVIDYARAWRTTRQRTRRAIAEMSGIVSVLAKNQAGGRSSFVSELAAAAPDALDDPTIVSNLVYMLMTASKDSSGLLVWIVKVLGDHPEWRLRVRNATRIPGQQQNLPGRIVRETLRMNQSEYLQRLIRRDIHVNGFIAPTGWLLRVCVWEGHRDPASFRNPNDFDPDRLLADNYARPSYAPFGASRIWCMGEHFTEVLAETVVTELARVDWDIVSDGPPELGTFHWQPSSGMRISLAPSTAR